MIDKMGTLIKEAMKAKDKVRLNALRYVKSLLLENKTAKKPIAEQDVIINYYKKLNASKDIFKENLDKFKEITDELNILKEFMPKQLNEAEVKKMIETIKSSIENANMGNVMKELTAKIKGQFDGKKASQMVKDILNK